MQEDVIGLKFRLRQALRMIDSLLSLCERQAEVMRSQALTIHSQCATLGDEPIDLADFGPIIYDHLYGNDDQEKKKK